MPISINLELEVKEGEQSDLPPLVRRDRERWTRSRVLAIPMRINLELDAADHSNKLYNIMDWWFIS